MSCGKCGPIIVRPNEADSDLTVLCDALGQAFLRRYSTDSGVVTTTDTDLDGSTPFVPVEPVGACGPGVSPEESPGELEPVCSTTVQTLTLCDLDPATTPDDQGNICPTRFLRHLAYDCLGALLATWDTTLDGATAYTVVGTVSDCGASGSALVTVPWEVVSVVDDPAGVPGQDFLFYVAPVDGSMPQGTIQVHTSLDDTAEPCPGPRSVSPGTTVTMTLDAAAQEMDFLRLFLRDLDTTESIIAVPVPTRAGGNAYLDGGVVRSNTENQIGWVDFENPGATITWTFDDPTRPGACLTLDFGGAHRAGGCCGDCGGAGGTDGAMPQPNPSVVERCRCDDLDGDGIGDVDYVELWSVDPTPGRRPVLIGTFTPDLGSTYDPSNPVDCQPDGPEIGATQPRRVVLTAGQTWDAAGWPLLRAVSLLVRTGTATVTDAAGTSGMIGGESAAWDAAGTDVLTGPLAVTAGPAGAEVVVNFTIGVAA